MDKKTKFINELLNRQMDKTKSILNKMVSSEALPFSSEKKYEEKDQDKFRLLTVEKADGIEVGIIADVDLNNQKITTRVYTVTERDLEYTV